MSDVSPSVIFTLLQKLFLMFLWSLAMVFLNTQIVLRYLNQMHAYRVVNFSTTKSKIKLILWTLLGVLVGTAGNFFILQL